MFADVLRIRFGTGDVRRCRTKPPTSVFYGRTGSSGSSVRTPPASMRRTTSESPFE